jgi:hypothetical protein
VDVEFAARADVGASGSKSKEWEELQRRTEDQSEAMLEAVAYNRMSLSSPLEEFGALSLEQDLQRRPEPISAEQATTRDEAGAAGSGNEEGGQLQHGDMEEEQLSSSGTLDGIPTSEDPNTENPRQDSDGPESTPRKAATQLSRRENKTTGNRT